MADYGHKIGVIEHLGKPVEIMNDGRFKVEFPGPADVPEVQWFSGGTPSE